MDKKFLVAFLLFSSFIFAQTDSTLIFSEIMFFPTSGPNEFIELYNFNETESIDLNGYQIKYSTSSPDIIIEAGEGTVLPPKSFAVIFEGDYPFGSGIYDDMIPPEALVLKISDNSFGSTGMANTSDRPVWLLSPADDTLQAYTYSADNSASFSDEKIEMTGNNSQSNWENSLNSNGTPGYQNSVTPLSFDLEMNSLTFSPVIPTEGDDVSIFAKVKNKGIENAASYSIEIYNDADFDSTADPGELIFSQNLSNLASGDSVTVSTIMSSLTAGDYQIISRVIISEDENLLNNELIDAFIVFPPGNYFNEVVLNELMYEPTSGEPEWVELFNRTSSQLNLKEWTISDLTTTVTITTEDKFIPPNSFVILTKDSSIINFYDIPSEVIQLNLPSLNNSGDAIVIKDSLDVLIDSVFYSPDWGGNSGGKSLERISADGNSNEPSNWGTSISQNKATPGRINSITIKDDDLTISSFIPTKDYGIIGEEIEFDISVLNNGLNQSQNFEVNLYRDVNADSIAHLSELIATQIGTALPSGDSTFFNFIANDFVLGLNYFISTVITSLDDDTTNNIAFSNIIGTTINEIRNDLTINEFMYSPESPQPEWIEVYNRGNKVIDLNNYQVADNSDTVKIVLNSLIINPGEYVVFADDTSIVNYYNIPSQIVIKNLPALNNSGDKIILLDSLNRTIDSLNYLSSWGGSNGNSLEKINADISSIDSTNWKTSISIFGATPGSINSVTQKDFDIAVRDIIFSPTFPLYSDTVSIVAKIINYGLNPASFTLKLFEDTNLDSIPDLLIETSSIFNLSPGDSNAYQFNHQIENILSKRGFTVLAQFGEDEDTTNNYFYKTVAPGFPPQSIVVNEIMYTPAGGEPEWIELFNNTNETIILNGWSISDIFTTPVQEFIDVDLFILPSSYLVLTKDLSVINFHRFIPSPIHEINLPVLNNDTDGIILRDNRGAMIDSVKYNSDWGGTSGYSLERKDVNVNSNQLLNWGTSLDIEQSTPGRINSVTPKQFDLSVAALSFNPRFPVSGDDVFVSAVIRNNGSSDASNFNVEFFIDTDSNNVVDYLLSIETGLGLASGDSANITSTFAIENLTSKVLTAVRIFYQEDQDTLNNYFEKSVQPGFPEKVIVINEVMYSPIDNEPEWVELINISGETLNLKNWAISDILSLPTINLITSVDLFLQPDEFIIIAKDTSFNSHHPEVTSEIRIVNFGSLGNTEDGIIIYDFREGIIDSLLYNSSWGGKNGYSLERISVVEETTDETNWTSSLSIYRSTPGAQNSIENAPSYEKNTLVINEIMFEPDDDNGEFVEFLNLSEEPVNIGGWRIEDENDNFSKLAQTSFDVPPNSYFVLAADSLVIEKYFLDESALISILDVSSLGLVNSGELTLLKDVKGNVIDSVWYSDKWHNDNFALSKNISLERINPKLSANDESNWSSSTNPLGGTPTAQNSIFTDNLNGESNISVSPNPFSPDNDGFEDFTIINYNLTQATSEVRIKIFDSKGRLVRTLLNNQPSGSSGSVIFDGRDDSGDALRIGIYIIFLEAINEGSGVVENMKTVVVVARKI
ncbi:MAG: lamin tail domain-containing protein [Ignavibacteriaceae bacterium]